MLPLFAPILAQLITLNAGDRTEVRYIQVDENHRYEAATRPLVGLNFGWKRSSLVLAYTPSFTVTPLESTPRNVLIFQAASLSGSYRWKRTTLTISEGVGYGEYTFQVYAIANPGLPNTTPGTNAMPGTNSTPGTNPTTPGSNPTTPGSNSTTPGTNPTTPGSNPTTPGSTAAMPNGSNNPASQQFRASAKVIHYGSSTTNVGLASALSREVAVGANAGYTIAGGVGDSADDPAYPLIHGANVGAFGSHSLRLNRNNTLGSSIFGSYNVSSLGSQAWGLTAGETWSHRVNPRTTTRLGVGLSLSRFSQNDGLVGYSVYPTFNAGINYFNRLAGGILTLGASAGSAPYLDPLRATVDPRVNVGVNAGWGKNRFSIGMGAGAAISIAPDNNNGAVNSIGASAMMAYRLGAGFSADTGVSAGWQTFEGETIVPASWTGFLGVTWAAQLPLNHH